MWHVARFFLLVFQTFTRRWYQRVFSSHRGKYKGNTSIRQFSFVSNDGISNAQIAELVVFGRALSTDEIYKLLYGNGVPIEGPMVKLEYGSPGI